MEKQKITGNEPVNPTIESVNHGDGISEIRSAYYGLTIRQQFAMVAMQGLLSGRKDTLDSINYKIADMYAAKARMLSDALIAELNK